VLVEFRMPHKKKQQKHNTPTMTGTVEGSEILHHLGYI